MTAVPSLRTLARHARLQHHCRASYRQLHTNSRHRLAGQNFALEKVLAHRPVVGQSCRRHSAAGTRQALHAAAGLEAGSAPATQAAGRTLVWFKNDLRLDDHPGVSAAAAASNGAVFVYCFDPTILAPLVLYPGALPVLLHLVHQLKQQLLAAGADLVVRVGSWSEVIPQLAASVGASVVIAEQEVESSLQAAAEAVQSHLSSQSIQPQFWDLHAWDRSALKPNFRTWKKTRGGVRSPETAPTELPPVAAEVDAGDIPTLEALQAMLGQIELQESNKTLQEAAEKVAAAAQAADSSREAVLLKEGVTSRQLLDVFLRQSVSPSAKDKLDQEMAEEITRTETPAAEGGSFNALFGWQLRFGALSRRRVLQLAEAASKGAPAWVSKPSTPWVAARAAAERSEFHHQLLSCEATIEAAMPKAQGLVPKNWRWRNMLADYCECHPPGGPHPESPAVLLLHGFGAFGTHWRFNAEPLTQQGYHVYAPTLPGFGRTEKVTIQYSQELWSSYLRDFVLHQVKQPVVLAGNSIGGFIASSFAAEYPELVSGLVLVNSAGPIDPKFSPDEWSKSVRKPPPAWLAYSISFALFYYLERSVSGTLKWLYPRNPQNADEWLTDEIVRAAADSGSLDVFKAVFYLPPPRALNYLVKELYGGPTLVLQGALDPLNDARARAEQLVQLCPNVTKTLIEAGHCPHDELPDAFNSALLDFLKTVGDREGAAGEAVQDRLLSARVMLESP